LASGFAIADLHHAVGHDRSLPCRACHSPNLSRMETAPEGIHLLADLTCHCPRSLQLRRQCRCQ
ncbi:MAG: hypothetical protein E5Y79_34490, partial [Mesorhizobium sp.]